jgi:hypothetical protein
MTKWILAFAMMLGGFAVAATPDEPVETGTCSYTCTSNNTTYINRTQCRAACSGTCVVEAC